MDLSKDMLSCRLCGLNIPDGNCKNIFEGSTDLMHKIKETLPISISTNDNGSKYLCLPCYEKIILYYKFVQEVVEYSKRIGSIMQKKSYFDFSKDMIDLSKIHSDAVYTCPNCNVNLMILLVSNPHGCDYTFQISLAMLNCSGKRHVIKESNIQERKNREEFIIAKNQIDLRNASKLVVADDNKNIPEQVSPAFPVLTEEPSLTSANTLLDKVKTEESNSFVPIQRKETRKEIECSEYLLNCDYDFVETVQQNEPGSDNTCWLGSDTDCKSNKGKACTNESENDTFKTDVVQDEHDVYKSCLKYICKLCGARYLSHMKYEFHMERHKLDKINKYECTVCDKETSNENMLWDHYFHTHKSQQRFVCIECGKLFAKRSRLNGHQKHYNHSGIRQIQIGTDEDNYGKDVIKKSLSIKQDTISVNCNLCGKIISDLDLDGINDLVTCPTCEDSTLSLMVDGNETKVISPRQYHCSMCPKHFVRKERLEFHEMRHNENMNEFVCSTCGKEFRAENSLYEHYLFVHKGARPHICELCGKSFQLKARLKEHHRIHTGERPYQCDVCGQRCRTMNALKLHRKIHFSHNKYTCNICNKTFTKKQNMNEHLEKHWKNDKNVTLPQLFTCPICTEDFPTYRMLRYHMVEVHEINTQDPILTKQKPWYECLECHEKFKHQMSLKAHKEKVHEGRVNPLYQCDTCNATYRVKQLLVNHIKSKHNGEKRYKCAQCEKGFNDTKSLYNHVLLHTGRKPFVCEYCNMSFRRKDSRDHHRRKHTGEQPYQCPDCGESFSTYNNRSKHRKKEHGEGDPECPECGERCSNQQEIRIHLNKHLGEKLNKLQSQI